MTADTDHLLTADEILTADDIVSERVDTPEWGGHVLVRGLTGSERDAYEQSMLETRGRGVRATRELKLDNVRAGLVARCVVDAAGVRLFNDTQISALGKKSAAALDRVFGVAQRLSGLGATDVEDLISDFPEATGEPSTSA